MDILKTGLAPISDEAWEQINETAQQTLKACLSGRRIVDVEGPKGWDYAAVPLGRLEALKNGDSNSVGYGVRRVQPLVESRIIFELDAWELDNATRGAEAIDLEPLEEAARKIAMFEESAIYRGFEEGGIRGLKDCCSQDALQLEGGPEKLLDTVAVGITKFTRSAVDGPYVLVAGSKLWQKVSEYMEGYPLKSQLETLLGSKIVLNPFLQESVLVSTRGGDMRLTIGQDFSIGYHSHTTEKVELYLTETFTFRVVDGAAIIPIDWKN